MSQRLAPFAVVVPAALLAAACTRQIPMKMAVEVVAEPEKAEVTFKGKALGETPANVQVGTFDELMSIAATRENAPVSEKRIRILSPDQAQLIFRFGTEVSPVAKKLGLTKVLVFDYSERVSFDSGKAELKPEALPILNRQAEILNQYFPGVTVHVCGHTDSTGGDELNMKLSVERAQAVANYLTAAKVDKARLVPEGFGKDYPIAPNATPDGRATNRRTELILPQ